MPRTWSVVSSSCVTAQPKLLEDVHIAASPQRGNTKTYGQAQHTAAQRHQPPPVFGKPTHLESSRIGARFRLHDLVMRSVSASDLRKHFATDELSAC